MNGRHIVIRRAFGRVIVLISDRPIDPRSTGKHADTTLDVPEEMAAELLGKPIADWLIRQMQGE